MRWVLLAACLAAAPAWADAVVRPTFPAPAAAVPISPFAQCDVAISAAAKVPGRLPTTLLPAIARVESGRLDASTGRVRPWPWTINVDGIGYFYDTKADVIAAVRALQAKGKRSIDVGCMQVNLMHHPRAFADLDQAFDPAANAAYAVQFLFLLYRQTRDWPLATAYYHSATPDLGEEYQRLVFGKVITSMGGSGGLRAPVGAFIAPDERYAAIPPARLIFGAMTPARPVKTNFAGTPALSIGRYPNLLQGNSMLPPARSPARR